MEKGNLRCEANVSVRRVGDEKFGTKVELKNLNSVRFMQKAIEFEIERQIKLIEVGRARHAGNASVGRARRRNARDALERRGARLSLFPEPDCRRSSSRRRIHRRRAGLDAGIARSAAQAFHRTVRVYRSAMRRN